MKQWGVLAFLFVDGLGLSADPLSPLHSLALPTLTSLSGHFSALPFDHPSTSHRPALAYRVLDATLGVEGLPQSGTGQTTLLTSLNAAQFLGYHQGPHPLTKLQGLLREHSIQVWSAQRGLRVLHTNSYRLEYLERTRDSRRNMLSSFAYAAKEAGLELLETDHPQAIAPAFWSDPTASGAKFAQLAEAHDLTILENWSLDYSAHRLPQELNARFLELDAFVQGFFEANTQATLVLTADHGNAEEPWHTQHTTNPVPLIVAGSLAVSVPAMNSLADLVPWIKKVLSAET